MLNLLGGSPHSGRYNDFDLNQQMCHIQNLYVEIYWNPLNEMVALDLGETKSTS